eukprot:5050001-Prymnesium_polylepis.1
MGWGWLAEADAAWTRRRIAWPFPFSASAIRPAGVISHNPAPPDGALHQSSKEVSTSCAGFDPRAAAERRGT